VEENTGQLGTRAAVEAPRGTLSGRVDEKGRLKLPAAIVRYLDGLGERQVFVTTLNASTAIIYPISVWRQTEKILQEPGDDADLRADVAFIANHYGEDAEVDGQGRVLMPTTLRQELEQEKDDVHLLCYKQRIEVFGSKMYSQRLEAAKANLPEKLKALEKKGLR
jgi:MraZ protein